MVRWSAPALWGGWQAGCHFVPPRASSAFGRQVVRASVLPLGFLRISPGLCPLASPPFSLHAQSPASASGWGGPAAHGRVPRGRSEGGAVSQSCPSRRPCVFLSPRNCIMQLIKKGFDCPANLDFKSVTTRSFSRAGRVRLRKALRQASPRCPGRGGSWATGFASDSGRRSSVPLMRPLPALPPPPQG